MKNTVKRLLSAALVLAMLVSMVPAVYATEDVQLDEPAAQAETVETTAQTVPETGAAEETTAAAEETTEAAAETTEAAVETTEAAVETTEATVETTEAVEETTEATEETTDETVEMIYVEGIGEVAVDAAATTGENMKAAGMTVISKTVNNVAMGVTYETITSRNAKTQQNMGVLTKVDLNNHVTIKAAYGGYYTEGSTVLSRSENVKSMGWSMVKPTVQASQYESIADKEGTVVMATNGDYFNMGTGEPLGYLVMEGNVIKKSSSPYFAILKDGTAAIRDGGSDLSDVQEAISGPFYLIKDGKNVAPADNNLMPRNSVGICADGSVVFYLNDGRQAPKSVGMTLNEVTSVLLDAGCVTAIYLDGGGSASVSARPEGSDKLQVINSPSDGQEREVSSSLMVISTAKPTGEFDHAAITPNDELYTPGSQVQFTATGVDSSGGPAAIPADVTWALAESSADMGTISESGLFTAADKTGVVTVEMKQNGKSVGSAFIEIVKPDEIGFNTDEVSLGFEDSTDFGLMIRYQGRDVNVKTGDIIWTTTNDAMGKFDGNIFTSSDGESLNGNVTATSAFDETVTATVHVIVGMLPTIVWDFEDKEGQSAEDYYGSILTHSNYNRGGKESFEIVSIDDGEPVRFGEKSMKLNFDFTQCGAVTEGACIGTTEAMSIPGTPTGIGVWVYAPEGVGITWEGDGTQAGFWLRGYVKDGTGTTKPYDFTLEPKAITGDNAGKQPGIYWEGWKYLEADLTTIQAPYSIQKGMTFRLMYVAGTMMGTKTANCIYFDNLQFVYGANVDDIDSPKVDSIKIGSTELVNGAELTSNTISLRTTFSDVENKYTSGVDASTVRMFVDGVNVVDNDRYQFALNANDGYAELYNLKLTDGMHSITVSLRDKFGNDAEETRYFTVKSGSTAETTVSVTPAESMASLGGVVTLEIKASDNTVTSGSTTIRLSNMFPDCEVVFSENYEGTYKYNKTTSTVSLTATRKEGSAVEDDNLIAKIVVKVPASLTANESFLYEVKGGSYETSNNFYGTYSAAENKRPVGAGIAVSCDPVLVGGAKAIVKVTDQDSNPVANAGIYRSDNDALIGTTDEKGELETDYFSAEPVKVSVYAKAEDGRISFRFNVISYAAAGSETAVGTQLLFNAAEDSATHKNISWISDPLTVGKQRIQYRLKGATGEQWETVYADTSLQTFNKGGAYQAANFNSVMLTGLKPGTSYEYQVGNGNTWSEMGTFTTDTGAGSGMKFFVMSDIQADDRTNVNNMIAMIKEGGYHFGIQTGDAIDDMMSYPQVSEAAQLLGNTQLGDIDMVHVLGNHEYSGDANAEIASSLYNLPESKPGSYYSVTYGDVYVAVINYAGTNVELTTALDWMVKDAQASNATWKVLTLHQPPYYTNANGGNAPMNTYVPAAAEKAGIDVVFSGHDHSLTRTNRLTGGEVDEANGILYYIGGSSGEKSYGVDSQSVFDYEKVFALATTDFTATYIGVSADKYKMVLDIYDVTGAGQQKCVDTFTLYTEIGACAAAGHNFENATYSDGKLICNDCGESVPVAETGYTGWATDQATGRSMFFMAGVAQTGKFLFGEDIYYFGDDGVALQGKATVDEVEFDFENGKIVGGYTGFIKKTDGNTYCYDNGTMVHSWYQDGEDWYFFHNVTGVMLTGKKVQPDDFSQLRDVRYDFGEDGKLVSGYFNKDGVYYWAGKRMVHAWVRNPEDPDPNAWYRTNSIGHFVTNGKDDETVSYKVDDVVYTFDNSNGKLIKGGMIYKGEDLYYYWAGELVTGWFEVDGDTYYAYEDGRLARGSCVIDGKEQMFTNKGVLVSDGVMTTVTLSDGCEKMTIKLANVDKETPGVVFAVWPAGADQSETIQWVDAEKSGESLWTVTIPMCLFNRADKYLIHAYSSEDGMRGKRLCETTVQVPVAVDHTYTDEWDAFCNICDGAEREVEIRTVPMYRLYNQYTQEHLLTMDEKEMGNLIAVGWLLDGIAWNSPVEGEPVFRLYNPFDDWHTYSKDLEEIAAMEAAGWKVDGAVCCSATEEDGKPIYRLFNPYEQVNYHLLSASEAEIGQLTLAGWVREGIAWYCGK